MIIDWSLTAVYNTIMSLSTGVALLLIVTFYKKLKAEEIGQLEGWALALGLNGFILTATGLHMTLTWPLSKMGFAFDDIIFGEASLGFGVMLSVIAILLWRKSNVYIKQGIDMNDKKVVSTTLQEELPYLVRPISYFGAAMGLGLISMGASGVYNKLFTAPPEEPITGWFSQWPWLETYAMSGLFVVTGIGAILFMFTQVTKPNKNVVSLTKLIFYVTGWVYLLFGALNYFTHVGLIVNTMG